MLSRFSSFLLALSVVFSCFIFHGNLLFANQIPPDVLDKSITSPELKNTHFLHKDAHKMGLDNAKLVNTKNKPVITVGYTKGMTIISDDTSYDNKGYGYDLLTKFGYFAGVDFEFVEIKGSLREALNKGIIDLGGLFSVTEERQEDIAFGKLPIHFVQYALTTKNKDHIFYDDPASIENKTVATFHGSPGNAFLDNYLEENNISVKYVYADRRNYEKIEADFYLLPSIKKTDLPFYSVLNLELRHLYFIANKENQALLDYLDAKLYDFFVANASFPHYLAEKYKHSGNEFQNRSLTRREAALLDGKNFKVGYFDRHAPYQETNVFGEPAGIAIDFMNILAEKYNFNVEYIPYNLNTSWTVFEDLDILISLVGERNHIARFYTGTDPYTQVNLNIIYQDNYLKDQEYDKANKALPKNAQVGILNYINFRYNDFFRDYPDLKIVHHTSTDDLLKAFVDEKIDAMIATSIGTNSVASTSAKAKYQTSLNLPLEMNFQISNKIKDDYLPLFDIIINKESENTIRSIIAYNTSLYMPTFGSKQFIQANLKYLIAAFIILCFFVFAFVLILRQRSKINIYAKDDITPLMSVSKFTEEADIILSIAKEGTYEMILMDIDYFRMINNYYGPEQGTEVIQAMANALLDAYKNTNTLICRRIAEQFIILKKVDQGPAIKEVVKSFVVPRIKNIVGENYSLKMSIAYCKNSAEDTSMNSLLDNVNIAHSEAKKEHNFSFVEFNDNMRKKSSTMLNIIYRMEHALANKEFKVHYQAKVSFDTQKIMGAEALVRWIPPIGDPIYPNDFIPIMEENGFISELELYIFEEVCSYIQKNKEAFKDLKIAVNISPITLSKSILIKQMVEILKKYSIPPSHIEIEITESALGNFEDTLPLIIKVLHKIGFSVAMDDFGAGNSSLNRLSVIEVDVLKLDKVFLDFHEDAPRGSLVVQQIIVLAKQLGMKIVAEGIEHENQAKWLKEIECDIAQGYYFAKPIKESDFLDLVLEKKEYSL